MLQRFAPAIDYSASCFCPTVTIQKNLVEIVAPGNSPGQPCVVVVIGNRPAIARRVARDVGRIDEDEIDAAACCSLSSRVIPASCPKPSIGESPTSLDVASAGRAYSLGSMSRRRTVPLASLRI